MVVSSGFMFAHFLHAGEKLGRAAARQRIKNVSARLAAAHYARVFQYRQMLRNRGNIGPGRVAQMANAFFAACQFFYYQQSGRVRERFYKFSLLSKFRIHIFPFARGGSARLLTAKHNNRLRLFTLTFGPCDRRSHLP